MNNLNLVLYLFFTSFIFCSIQPNSASANNTRIEAENFSSTSNGVRAANNSATEGGQCIGYITNGAFACYKSINFDGVKRINARVSSATHGGTIELRIDSRNGKLLGSINVSNTNGWNSYITKSVNINTLSGTHDLYLVFKGSSGYLLNVNWIELVGRSGISGTSVTGTLVSKSSVNTSRIQAENFSSTSNGVRAANNGATEGGQCIGYITNGAFACYKSINFSAVKRINTRVSSATHGGTIELRIDSRNGKLLGSINVSNTNGWNSYITKSVNINTLSGTHDLYLVFKGSSGYLLNVNWIELVRSSGISVSSATGTTVSKSSANTSRIEAENFSSTSNGVRAANNDATEGGQCIGYITNGAFACYRSINFNGVKKIRTRVSSATKGGTIELRIDSRNGKLLGSINVSNTKGWNSYITRVANINAVTGTHDLYLVFKGPSGYLLNVNWIEL